MNSTTRVAAWASDHKGMCVVTVALPRTLDIEASPRWNQVYKTQPMAGISLESLLSQSSANLSTRGRTKVVGWRLGDSPLP